MADTLESLEIEVVHSSKGAGTAIGAITRSLGGLARNLDTALPKLKEFAETLGSIGAAFTYNDNRGSTFNKTVQNVKQTATATAKVTEPMSEGMQMLISGATKYAVEIEKAAEAERRMQEAFKSGDAQGAWSARGQMLSASERAQRELAKSMPTNPLSKDQQNFFMNASDIDLLKFKLASLNDELQKAFTNGDAQKAAQYRSQIISTEKALEKAELAAKRAAGGVQELAKESKKSSGALAVLGKSIARIAFYRAIRSVIKSVTQAFQEGLEAAYTFSSGIAGEGHRFAQAMDNMKIAGNMMKGQLGSAFIALYAAIAPIIIAIINLITKLADAMSQLFSAFTGKTYLKAQANASGLADSMAGGAKAAKEWKNQLMGFDEINKLEAPGDTGGGGSGGAANPFSFEDTPLDDWAMKIHDSLAAIELAASGFMLALGLILTLSGANIPLGLALIALGAMGFIHALKEDWSTVDQQVARVLSAIMLTLGGALLAVGALLAFSGANLPLGIGLMAAGAVMLAGGAIIDWKVLPHDVKTVLSDIMLAAGGAMLALGLIITFATPAFSPLGLGLIIAGAASLAAAAAINWDYLTELMQGKLGAITAMAGGALLAIGLILALSGVALPLGIGLMIAGGLALGSVVALNWDTISEKVREALDKVKAVFQERFQNILNDCKLFIEGVKNIFKGLSDFLNGAFSGDWQRAWNGIVNIFRGIAQVIQSIVQQIIGFVQRIISAVRNAISAVGSLFSATGGGGGGIGAHFPSFASGGFPEDGLFFANHGEMVGQFANGKTAVANNQEIVEGIKQGVIEAMLTVGGANSSGGKQTEFVFNLNGREFARAIYNDQNAVQREHGVSYLANA